MDRPLIFQLATGRFLSKAEDALFLGPPGTGKSHLVQAIGRAVILAGWEVAYREAHILLEELADATLDGTRKEYLKKMQRVPRLVIDDLGLRQLPKTARGPARARHASLRAHQHRLHLEPRRRRVGQAPRPHTATSALLDRLLHHAHVVQCGPRSYRMLRKEKLEGVRA